MLLLTLMTLACRPPADQTPSIQPELLVSADEPCLAALGGPAAQSSLMADWSRAHATRRFFAPSGDWLGADEALTESLELNGPDFAAYAEGVDEACLLEAAPELGAAQVELVDQVAWVTPGSGTLEIPSGAEWVVLDLSGAPAGAAGDQALLSTLGQLLGSELALGRMTHRSFDGHPNNWSASGYGSSITQKNLTANASGEERELAVWMGAKGSPMAHRIAAALRLQERGFVLGHDAHAVLAESTWAPVGDQGLLLRTGLLDLSGQAWPDRVPADLAWARTDVDAAALSGLSWTELPLESTRSELQEWDATAGYQSVALTAGSMQAAFLVAHGVLDRFWLYSEVTGTDLDASLDAALVEVESLAREDRVGMERAVGHFMHTLDDGHGFYSSLTGGKSYTQLDLQIQLQGEQVLVRASDEPGVFAGDEIVAVDGLAVEAWFEEAMSRRSAATQGYRFDQACAEMLEVEGVRTLGLRSLDGSEREVALAGSAPEDAGDTPWGGTFRPSGPLDDLGAPEIYYLNLNGDIDQAEMEVLGHLRGLEAEGLVVDMRDYPSVNHYAVIPWLCADSITSPWFGIPTWDGPRDSYVEDSNYVIECEDGAYTGPISLLVSNKSVSAAENFSQMLVTQEKVTVVGQQSAGTNGNITLAFLPGGLFIYFTGMRILNPDSSVFHGVGILPDVPVTVTAQDFADGLDPELEAAVRALLE